MVNNVLSSLISSLSGGGAAGSLVKDGASGISSQLAGSAPFGTAVVPTGSGGTTPQAYLTMLFFDERFNFISAADGGVVQAQVASSWSTSTAPLALANTRAPKNGYVYVYISNRSDQDVYFDDFKVSVTAGNIIEEDHYYAFGLKIAAISSKKLGNINEGVLKNDYLYNDKELYDDGDLNWYDYGFRNYDAQIGKFIQMDPLADGNSDFSPYSYAANDPIGNIDFLGLDAITSTLSTTAETAITLGTVTITAVKATSAGLSTVSLASKVISITSITLRVVNTASTIINSNITTSGVGSVDPGRRFAIEARGFNEGFRSALTLGMSEWFSGDPLNDYSTTQEKLWYLEARLKGDAAAVLFGLGEAEVGTGGLATTGITGVGAVVSGVAIAHGLSVAAKGTADIALTWQKIYKLNMAGSSGGDASSSSPSSKETLTPPKPKSGRTIVESKEATKALDKLSPNMKKNVESAIDLIRKGEAGGNQHSLTGDLKGYKAIDVKGSGKGRGALRIVYKESDNEIFIHSIQDYH